MELWKDINNYKGIYQISNLGNCTLQKIADKYNIGKTSISRVIRHENWNS